MAGLKLKSLADRPFDLLQEMERRSRAAIAGQADLSGKRNEWVGVGFSIGGDSFVANRDHVGEVLMVPDNITRVPGAKRWLMGVANLRGQLLPLIDLKLFLGAGRSDRSRNARVISVGHREVRAGLLVEEVSGFRRFVDGEYSQSQHPTTVRADAYTDGFFMRSDERWPVFQFDRLLSSDPFLQAAESPRR